MIGSAVDTFGRQLRGCIRGSSVANKRLSLRILLWTHGRTERDNSVEKGVEDVLDGMTVGFIGLMHQTTKADNATTYQISAQVRL